ncbi:ArsR family regulatory protein [Halorhabdus tiamatea SARL4B]|uniref:ArsR family regulatory protein n=1 Tax=Halorhabdus tiamatea SARL4B TaxID=1033806 RepID=F7PPX6_9EURY|nr:helix-turn-helix domain-containing protein [Halorhabdus tiamatea]ERJ05017.1 ArsR family regulatory protein [Halorhabdus tiamatea SARL4B]CCQ32440.1 transcriptional regulator, MarR family [Halorhabdus tiamatea SARL4B]
MGKLLPRRGERGETAEEPRVLGLTEGAADEAFAALSSETARRVLALVYDDPRTPVEIREEIGTSLQNVHYHVEKLESADLIESVGTDYSAKGNEMNVYAPTSEALVLVAGEEEHESLLKRAVGRLLAGVGVLAAGALTFGFAIQQFLADSTPDGTSGDSGGVGAMDLESTETAAEATDPLSFLGEPAVAFFVGGAFVLAVVGVWWYARRR